MTLTLVLGPANAAKAGEVLGAYASAAHRGALLVVPTAADAEHYGREVAEQGAVLGSVITFAGLASEIARRAGYRSARLSALGRERVMRRVVGQASLRGARRVGALARVRGGGRGARGRARAIADHAAAVRRRAADLGRRRRAPRGLRARPRGALPRLLPRARAARSGRPGPVRLAGARRAAGGPRTVGR